MRVEFHTTIAALMEDSGGTLLYGRPETEVVNLSTDSRETGEKCFFIPLKGEKFDGHDYILPLLESGTLSGFLTSDRERFEVLRDRGAAAVLTDNTLEAYGRIAAAHRNRIKPLVVGVTGTNGKTTCKEILWTILGRRFTCLKNEKNYNNEVGVPFTLLHLRERHNLAVIEMGMNHEGEIGRLSRMARPNIALITNVGEGHLEFLGSVENVARAKAEIMEGMSPGGKIFINADTPYADLLREKALDLRLEVETFGLGEGMDLRPDGYELHTDHLVMILQGVRYQASLYGLHNVYNVLGAIAVSRECGMSDRMIQEGLGGFNSVSMRRQVIDRGFVIINDNYNSNPLSSRYALESVRLIFPARRKVAVFSDMKELGKEAPRCHREIGAEVVRQGFDSLYTWGEEASHIHEGALEAGMDETEAVHFVSKEEMIRRLESNVTKNDVVLVKGSRAMKMEEVVNALVHD